MTVASLHGLARADVRAIPLYAPDRAPCRVDLSNNTNLWGAPPAALRALAGALPAAVARYPEAYAGALRQALADYLGADTGVALGTECIVTGCGSDDVLDSAFRALAGPGDVLAHPEPSFTMVPAFARMNGLRPVAVPLRDGVALDADAMLRTGAPIIYLSSPNNPTGNALAREAVERVVRRAPGVVILDEAYAEFAGTSALDLLRESERLLVTRTLSKAFGLAGLRVGYAAGAPALVAAVEKSRGPYKVNALAERAALAVLGEDLPWVRAHVAEAVTVRDRLTSELRALGLEPLPSVANFVLVPVPDAVALAARLRDRGVGVRPFTALPGIGDALRISVGPWPLVADALDALRAVR